MYFATFNAHTNPLLCDSSILKFTDVKNIESCIFASNCFNRSSYSIFTYNYKLISASHTHRTRSVNNGLLLIQNYNTMGYGWKSIVSYNTLQWNHFQKCFHGPNFLNLTSKLLTGLRTKHLIFNIPRTMKI